MHKVIVTSVTPDKKNAPPVLTHCGAVRQSERSAMSEEKLSTIVRLQQAPNYVAPFDDVTVGQALRRHGYSIKQCRNRAQRQAFKAEPAIEDDYADIRKGF